MIREVREAVHEPICECSRSTFIDVLCSRPVLQLLHIPVRDPKASARKLLSS